MMHVGVVAAAAAVSSLTSFTSTALTAANCPAGDSMYVVAHEDDSILFQNPDLQRDISNGRCVQTIFLTAGDADRIRLLGLSRGWC